MKEYQMIMGVREWDRTIYFFDMQILPWHEGELTTDDGQKDGYHD
jgi:hypothetical protein